MRIAVPNSNATPWYARGGIVNDRFIIEELTYRGLEEQINKGLSERISESLILPIGMPKPARVIYNRPATIVFWDDGTKTVVKCSEDDHYDPRVGLLTAMVKRAYGNHNRHNTILNDPEIKPTYSIKELMEKIFGCAEKIGGTDD